MRYPAVVTREDGHVFADFPDCEGCHTFAERGQSIEDRAKEALESWLESCLVDGSLPPQPTAKPRGEVLWVDLDADLSLKLQLRWARDAAGLTQARLAELAGVSQQMVAKLESPRYHPRLDALEGIARALGVRLSVELRKPTATVRRSRVSKPLRAAAKRAPKRSKARA